MSRLTGTDALNLMEAYQAVYAPRELTEEQVWEEVESWVNSLVEEGYDLSDYTWDDLYEYYVSEGYKRMNRGKIERQAQRLGGERGEVLRTLTQMVDRPDWRKHSTSQARKNRAGGAGSDYRKRKELQARDDAKADIKKHGLYGDKKETNEQVELYDIIFSHLLDEGYATTENGALAIMSNMSEDWVHSIVEGYVDLFKTPPARGQSMKGDPSKGEKFGNPARLSPAMRALQRSDQLRASEPGSRRQIMQTRRSGQINRTFRSARLAGGASSSLGGIGTPSGTGRYTPGGRYGIGGVGLAD